MRLTGMENIMKKLRLLRDYAVLCAAVTLLMAFVAGCGPSADEVKRIDKETAVTETSAADAGADTDASAAVNTAEQSVISGSGYIYHAEGANGDMDVSVDMPMSDVLDVLGESESYFEAKSCAFDGLDKMYTYEHYEIDTYPAEDGDRVSAVFLTDDLTGTAEGLYIGSSKDDMENIYGTDYEVSGSEYTYKSGDMSLKIQISNGKVSYITYASKVLGTVAGN